MGGGLVFSLNGDVVCLGGIGDCAGLCFLSSDLNYLVVCHVSVVDAWWCLYVLLRLRKNTHVVATKHWHPLVCALLLLGSQNPMPQICGRRMAQQGALRLRHVHGCTTQRSDQMCTRTHLPSDQEDLLMIMAVSAPH